MPLVDPLVASDHSWPTTSILSLHSSYPYHHSRPQPLPALLRPTQTRNRPLTRLIHLLAIILVQIIKRQFLARRNEPARKERNVIHPAIMLVVADRVLATIRLAAMVDEFRRAAHELAVDDVQLRFVEVLGLGELVERVEV